MNTINKATVTKMTDTTAPIKIDDDDLAISDFNAADYFEDDAMAREYLDRAFADGDPEVALHALGQVAKYRGIDDIASKTGLPRSSLYRYFSGKGNPSFANIQRVIHSLDLNLHIGA